MMRAIWIILAVLAAAAGGCAPGPATPASANRSTLTLDQIRPIPHLPSARPESDTPAPIAAIVHYAAGIDHVADRPADAIDDFRQAAYLDPNRYEIQYQLGMAYLQLDPPDSASAQAALQKAASLRPDDLRVHVTLARLALADGNNEKGLQQLRLAELTTEYQSDEAGAANAELFLAHLLADMGYSTAALDQYTRLADHLEHPTMGMENDPDVSPLLDSPQWVQMQIADLCAKLHRYQDALLAYQKAQVDPADFDPPAGEARMLDRLGNSTEAIHLAVDLVRRFAASAASMTLLRDVCHGDDSRQIAALREEFASHPDDMNILGALADVTARGGRIPDAIAAIESALRTRPGDVLLLRKRVDLRLAADNPGDAVRDLILTLAARPDLSYATDSLLDDIRNRARPGALDAVDVQTLSIPDDAKAAQLYVAALWAGDEHRELLARKLILQAVDIVPASFTPAFWQQVEYIWTRPDLDDKAKDKLCTVLANHANSVGRSPVAHGIRALSAEQLQNYDAAIHEVDLAMQDGDHSPELTLEYAQILFADHQDDKACTALWDLAKNVPQCEEAWTELRSNYDDRGLADDALKVLAEWLKADPGSVSARLAEAEWDVDHQSAESLDRLSSLLNEHNDDPRVLAALAELYTKLGEEQTFTDRLGALHAAHPENIPVAEALASADAKQLPVAAAVLDQTKAAVAQDASALADLADTYQDLGLTVKSQQTLRQAVAADPHNATVANDLGYLWADDGRHLDEAEQLIGLAVAAQPDNAAFLDSLGWVLYKRGEFAKSAEAFQSALNPIVPADPAILDHYGDDLYRLGRTADALTQWHSALDTLGDPADTDSAETTALRLQLRKKVDAATRHAPAPVAQLGITDPAAPPDPSK